VASVDRGRSGNFARVLVDPVAGVDSSRMLLVLLTDLTGVPAPPPVESADSIRSRRGVRRD